MKHILSVLCLALCTVLRAASLPVSFNTTTHKIAAPLDLWPANSTDIYNGLGLSGMSLQSPSSVSITGGSITGVAGLGYTANPLSQFAATTSAQLAGVLSDETGSGSLVFGTSPTLTTPALGVATATSINGTTIPSSKTLVVTTDKLSVHASTTSSELFGIISDETGSGSLVGSASPTLTGTPVIGAAIFNSSGMGIGNAPSSTAPLDVVTTVNSAVQVRNYNLSTGSSAYSDFTAQSDGGSISMRAYSAAHSVWPDTSVINPVNMSGGVAFHQSATGAPWIFYGEGTERFRVLPTGGVTIGTAAANAQLHGEAANIFAQRSSTSAQTLRVYGTFTDVSNFERISISTSASTHTISSEVSGTGNAGINLRFNAPASGDIYFSPGNANKWRFVSTGALLTLTDNAYDIGSSGANRPRNLYVAGTGAFGGDVTVSGNFVSGGFVDVPSTGTLRFLTRARMLSPSDGVLTLYNNGVSSFDRIQYGGTGSGFPAHKRNGATVEARLADDSGYAATQSLYDRFGSGTPEGSVTAPVGAVYHRTDGGAGTSFYVKESGTGNTGWVAK